MFADLHETFPFYMSIDHGDYIQRMGCEPGTFLNSSLDNWNSAKLATGDSAFLFISEALDWLREEGFVMTASRGDTQYRLTAKAFAALKTTPDAISGSATLGQSLADAAKMGGQEAGKAVIGKLAETAISIGTRLMLNGSGN